MWASQQPIWAARWPSTACCSVHGQNLTVLAPYSLTAQDGKIAVLVGTVTDDVRLFDVPKMRVVALRFTETARARIVKVSAASFSFSVLEACNKAYTCAQKSG